MKNRLKMNSICMGLFFLSCTMLISCDKEATYDFQGDTQNRVYLKSASNTVNGSTKISSFMVTKTPVGIMSDIQIKIPIFSTLKANEAIEVGMSIDNSIVDKYNITNGTTFNTIPVDMLTFINQSVTILSDATASKDSIEITANQETMKSLSAGKYLVPLVITDVKGTGVSISSNKNATYIIVDVEEDTDNIWAITPDASVRGMLLTESRLDWAISFANISANISTANNIGKMFDGDSSTYSYCIVNSYDDNTGFVIDMQKEYSNLSGVQKNYYSGGAAIKVSDVYTSKNGTDWTLQGKYENSNSQYSEIIFYAPVEARYLKFIVRSAPSKLYIRELNVYTK